MRKWLGDPVNGWLFDRLWIYDGDHRLFSLDSNMHRIEEYAYAPGIDLPIATIRGNTGVDAVGYHVQDELGNILGIIENGAYISQTNSYDADREASSFVNLCEVQSATSPIARRHRFGRYLFFEVFSPA